MPRFILSFMTASLLFGGCSYQPEDPGQCKLTCSKAIIGGNDMVFTITSKVSPPATTCAPDGVGQTVGPYQAYFLVGENILDETKTVVGVRPVPNVSIDPIVTLAARPTLGNDNDNTAQYKGLYTPKDNWCSDACGVVELSAASVCPGVDDTNDLALQIHSGALFSDSAVFSVTTKAPTALRGETVETQKGK